MEGSRRGGGYRSFGKTEKMNEEDYITEDLEICLKLGRKKDNLGYLIPIEDMLKD